MRPAASWTIRSEEAAVAECWSAWARGRLAYVRGPEGIIVSLAERTGPELARLLHTQYVCGTPSANGPAAAKHVRR